MAVLSDQARSIAEEMIATVQLPSGSRISVFVEGGDARSVIENSLIEAIQKRGVHPRVVKDPVPPGIHVVVLQQEVHYQKNEKELFERQIRTHVEGRWVNEGLEAVFLGRFKRTGIDTVSSREDRFPESKATLLEQVLGPIVVIAGVIVAVYLLFTVRS